MMVCIADLVRASFALMDAADSAACIVVGILVRSLPWNSSASWRGADSVCGENCGVVRNGAAFAPMPSAAYVRWFGTMS